MNARFLRLYLMPLLVSFGLLQSCRFLNIGLIDYPPIDHTQLKGPSAKSLETRIFRLSELVTYPFYGSTLQVNQQFLLFGENEAAGRLAQITPSGVSELSKSV